jgi:ABC-type uncharacterized transport system permease subunit
VRRRLNAYRHLAVASARTVLVYRANYVTSIVGALLQILLLKVVWTAVYAGRSEIDGVELSTMVAYVTLTSLQMWFVMQSSTSMVPERVREGKIAADLLRPVGLLEQTFAGQLGRACVMLPLAVLVLPLAVVVGDMRLPDSPAAGVGYLVSLALAIAIALLLGAVLGLIAFWTLEVRGILFVYRHISQFLSGALVPLWFMPDWLRLLAEMLPFQAIAATPVSIYLGRLTTGSAVRAIAIQVVWVVLLYLLGRVVWRGALRKVVIQGG